MVGDIELAGFVITRDEWEGMDRRQRAQLVRAALRRDEPWIMGAPATMPAAPLAIVPEATPRLARGSTPPEDPGEPTT